MDVRENEATKPVPGTTGPGAIPDHVPAELVFTPAYEKPNTLDDPFIVSADVHEDLPPIFYWPRPSPGRYDGTWVVTHYDDIRQVYEKSDLYSTLNAANFQSIVGETFHMIPLGLDPPEHTKYRMFLNPWFAPKSVAAMEEGVTRIINELIDEFGARGECDVAYEFGRIYPVRVFLDLMGFPREKLEDFLLWEYSILHAHGDIEKIKFGVTSALAYLRTFIEAIRQKPDDGLVSQIVHGRIEGNSLTEDEILGMIFLLWVGGLDTVAATTSLMFRRLAIEPDLQQQLREDPSQIPKAVEEFLRMQPLVNSSRMAKQDHEINGVRIKAGDHVMCYNLAGNFDADQFEEPREPRFDRVSNRHLTFGAGPHICLGIHLARRELRIALNEFLRRIPPFRLKPGADRLAYPGLVAAPRVPIVWDVEEKS